MNKLGMMAAVAGLALAGLLPAGAGAQGTTGALPKVKVGLVNVATVVPIYIAQDKGYFKDEGLDTEIDVFPASVPIIAALISGDVQFGNIAYSGAVFNAAAKGQIKVISGATRDGPGFHLNAMVATKAAYDRGFTKLTDLPKYKFSTTTVGGTTDYIVGVLARKYHFDVKSVELTPLQTLDNQNAAFIGNQIDGGMLSAIFANKFEQQGIGKILAWTGDEVTWAVGGEMSSPGVLKDHPDWAAKYVRAYQRGVQYYQDNVSRTASGDLVKGPNFDDVVAIASKNLKLAPEAIPAVLADFYPKAAMDIDSMKDQLTFLQGLNQVDKNATIDQMIDTRFLGGAAK